MIGMKRIPVYCVYNDTTHPALALGMIVAAARNYKNGMLNQFYEFVPGIISSLDIMRQTVWAGGTGVLLCSDYQWSSEHNLMVSKLVKAFFPGSVTIHGGPSAPKYDYACDTYLSAHPYVDIVARGAGEQTAAEVLEQLVVGWADGMPIDSDRLQLVTGITFRHRAASGQEEFIRTPERPAAKDLDALPSPYLSNAFAPDAVRHWRAAIVETNRGCPYGCTFCDWGSATLSKIRQFSMERVAREIEWVVRHKISTLWIADANFGIFERDVEIARLVARCKAEHGFPRQIVVNYAKNATARLAEIVEIFRRVDLLVDGIISIQTHDEQVLSIINRSNISLDRYDDLIRIFRENNLPISTDIMIGLPGSTLETFKEDLQFFFDRGVAVKCYNTSLLPNSPMAHRDYIDRYEIETNSSNGLVSTFSYTRADLRRMNRLAKIYLVAVEASMLKYFLIYLQTDHSIIALDFLDNFSEQVKCNRNIFPETAHIIEAYPASLSDRCSRNWDKLYDEVRTFLAQNYDLGDPAIETVLRVQQAIMPANDRIVPETLRLDHDFVSYFRLLQCTSEQNATDSTRIRRLSSFGEGVLTVSDPNQFCGENSADLESSYDSHSVNWELASELNIPVSRLECQA